MTKNLSIQTTDLSIQKIISYKRHHEKHKSNKFMHQTKSVKLSHKIKTDEEYSIYDI